MCYCTQTRGSWSLRYWVFWLLNIEANWPFNVLFSFFSLFLLFDILLLFTVLFTCTVTEYCSWVLSKHTVHMYHPSVMFTDCGQFRFQCTIKTYCSHLPSKRNVHRLWTVSISVSPCHFATLIQIFSLP